MSEEIHDIDLATMQSRGVLAIDPSGHMVTLGRAQSLKNGFRLATRAEVNAAADKANPTIAKAAPVAAPAPAPVEEKKFLGRKSPSTEESNAMPKEGPRTERKD